MRSFSYSPRKPPEEQQLGCTNGMMEAKKQPRARCPPLRLFHLPPSLCLPSLAAPHSPSSFVSHSLIKHAQHSATVCLPFISTLTLQHGLARVVIGLHAPSARACSGRICRAREHCSARTSSSHQLRLAWNQTSQDSQCGRCARRGRTNLVSRQMVACLGMRRGGGCMRSQRSLGGWACYPRA